MKTGCFEAGSTTASPVGKYRLAGAGRLVTRNVLKRAMLTGLCRVRTDLSDVRINDLRHSFASRALALGEGLPMIGKLLGHAKIETTARYAHLARDSVREAAERIARSIAGDILV